MLYVKDLEKVVFQKPIMPVDEFVIVSGWLGPNQIQKANGFSVKIIALYGMSSVFGVPGPTHKILQFMANNSNTKIYYSLPGAQNQIHTKCYVWKFKGKIVSALIGSANFTYNGLSVPYKEVLMSVEPGDFLELENYLKYIFDSSRIEPCSSGILKTRISSIPRTVFLYPKQIILNKIGNQVTAVRLTLLDRTGKLGSTSGINWGQGSKAHTNKNDAYIKISKAAIRTGFFSPKSYARLKGVALNKIKNVRIPIDVIWDDGTTMNCLEEGNQTEKGVEFPKQISSAESKKILGEYLRKRLGVPSGQKVAIQDLEQYGRTFIDITRTGPNSYYFDFSKP